ncbi:hypothetical protein [Edaphocola aurantiacus]|uniref:hypothetical protein n=1 Tax=Edaphocola aurantiacus TaxID=2601682 RepID=UPI001C9672B5|nr:hypothetical protein [Edaphocola aurantiacus]
MSFWLKDNRNLNKQAGKPLQFSVGVYLIFVLSVTFFSCHDAPVNKIAQHKLQSTDTLKIRAENIFRIYVSKIPAANGRDSLLLLLDRNASLLYKIDASNQLLAVDTLPEKVTEDLKAFTYFKGKYCVEYEDTLKMFMSADFNAKPNVYTFKNGDVYAYQSIISEFKIDKDQSFLIFCMPKINNLIDAAGRERYFSSKVVHKGVIIEKGKAQIETKPIGGITFPEYYKKSYYNDLYPVFCSFGDSIAYTYHYCDSIVLISGGKKEYFKIPEQFSVIAKPIPAEYVQSRTELDAYAATHSANCKLLQYKQKILLFQTIRVDRYYDEQTGMLNDYLSQKKRMLVFDMDKKQFEQTAYELPANCAPVKSCIFNGMVYLLSTDDTRKTILVTAVEL